MPLSDFTEERIAALVKIADGRIVNDTKNQAVKDAQAALDARQMKLRADAEAMFAGVNMKDEAEVKAVYDSKAYKDLVVAGDAEVTDLVTALKEAESA